MELLGMKIVDKSATWKVIKYFAQCYLFNLPDSIHRMHYENPKMNANIGKPENDRSAKHNGFIMLKDDSDLEKERQKLIWGKAYRQFKNVIKIELGIITDASGTMYIREDATSVTCPYSKKEIAFTKEGINAHIIAEWKASKKKKGKATVALIAYLSGNKKASKKSKTVGLSAFDKLLADHAANVQQKIAKQTARVERTKKASKKRKAKRI